VGLEDGVHELVEATACLGRDRHGLHAAHLRQQPLGLFAQLGKRFLGMLDQVPFVEGSR
jgi:hypothetical protein